MTVTPPDEVNPFVWRRFADEDLAAAKATLDIVVFPRQSSYHSQQAAEKAIKAVLLHLGQHPPFIHDIAALVTRIPQTMRPVVSQQEMADLTSWAVVQRYPGIVGTVAKEDAFRSLLTATTIVDWMHQWVH